MGAILAALANPIVWMLLIVALGVGAAPAYFAGRSAVKAAWDLERAEIALGAAEDARNRAQATVQVVNRYIDRITVVTEKADEIVREVPVLVRADERVSPGFVCVVDRGAAGDPSAPCELDGTSAGVGADRAAEVIVRNYARYHKLSEQVWGLQEYIDKVCIGVAND